MQGIDFPEALRLTAKRYPDVYRGLEIWDVLRNRVGFTKRREKIERAVTLVML
jgi:hypothetical protein